MLFLKTASESAIISKLKEMWDIAKAQFMDQFIALGASFRK